jgi:hypothetical protein
LDLPLFFVSLVATEQLGIRSDECRIQCELACFFFRNNHFDNSLVKKKPHQTALRPGGVVSLNSRIAFGRQPVVRCGVDVVALAMRTVNLAGELPPLMPIEWLLALLCTYKLAHCGSPLSPVNLWRQR